MRKLLSFVFFQLLSFCGHAQNVYMDSLRNELAHAEITISEKMNIYRILMEQSRSELQYDQATAENRKLIALAKSQNDDLALTKAYVYQGVIYNNQHDYKNDRVYLDSARVFALKSKSEIANAYTDYLEAIMLNSYQDYEAAIKSFQRTLSIVEDTNEEFLKAKIYYNLYSIYTNWNDMENSFLYANEAVKSAHKSGDKSLLSNAYSALAVAYTYRYDAHHNKDDLEKIFDICRQAIDLNKQYKGQVSTRTYAIAKLNIASYYFKYYPEKLDLIKAQIHEALEAGQLTQRNQAIIASCYGMLSEIAQREQNETQAESYLHTAYSILLTENPIYLHTMIRICDALATWYDKHDQHEKSFEFQKLTTDYTRQLFNEEQAATAKRLEAQYQFDKKEQELLVLKERAENHRKQQLLSIGLGIVGLFGSFFMFRSYHFRLRYSLEREKQLATEKSEAELQVKLEKEEQSRLKAEQKILTLQQEKLQNEVMANQLHLQHKNEVFQQLKEKIDKDNVMNIQQILRNENLLDNDFEKAKFQIQELHPNFFKTLTEKAQQKLTPLDLKYCAYFYLGMDTKQIANLLNVEPKSVRMTKYRLKQKFGLDTETDLMEYLRPDILNQ
ncbi:hypothetical protein DC487_11070 [Sphingobacterium corticibacter]|uniref:HTH luxR-type domain-containing protein n=2 Tax=Sphingobacterium corticibacter TaxID=2171749 RepID=A0A2T8HJ29_9SPHI|nr:hypothetical protein DC487_11070 [Sphingobacterium corticibacter]